MTAAAIEANASTVAQVLSAIAQLLWPVVALALAYWLLPELKLIFRRISESKNLKVKWGDKELSVQEAADNIQKVVGSLLDAEVPKRTVGAKIPATAPPENLSLTGGVSKSTDDSKRRILWVDDHPKSNALEKAWLENRGIKIDEATSTLDATFLFSPDTYALVITDMHRKEDGVNRADAGIELLKSLRLSDPSVKVIAYCAAVSAKRYGRKFIDSGGTFVTSDPIELLDTLNRYLSAG